MRTPNRHASCGRAGSAAARMLLAGLLLCGPIVEAVPAEAQAPAPWTTSLRVLTPTYELADGGPAVPGCRLDDTPGAPALPACGTVIELPAGGDYEITFESPGAALLAGQSEVRAAPAPDLSLYDRGRPLTSLVEEISSAPTIDRPDPAIYAADAFYPASPVVDGGVQWQRGRRLLALRVFPFQYNPVTKVLRYHPDLRIIVSVREESESGSVGVWESGSVGDASAQSAGLSMTINPAVGPMADGDGSLRIVTPGGGGMVRLTYGELAAKIPSLAQVDPATFALSYLGDSVAAEVTGDGDAAFEPGELVIYYAQPYTGRYQTENVYWLTWGGDAGLRMETFAAEQPDIAAITTITQTLHVERNLEYRSTYPRPRDADHWFDLPLSPDSATGVLTATRVYDLALDDDALPTGDMLLAVTLHGAAAQTPNPDKAIRLQLNSHVAGTYRWDGLTYTTTAATVPATALAANNQLTLTAALSLLSGVSFYTVSPDWAELAYPATADAYDGGVYTDKLTIEALPQAGDGGDPNKIAATGFSSSAVQVYDLRDPNLPVRVLTTVAISDGTGGYTLNFWDKDTPGATYFLTTEDALAAAVAIEPPALDSTPSPLASAANRADYIAIVYHDPLGGEHDLWDATGLDTLLAHRADPAGDNFRVAKVDVQQIYDEFSYGRRDPEAIRTFLTYAYNHWKGPDGTAVAPRYVLLVGDGHHDFTNASDPAHPDLIPPNLIPPYLAHVDPWLGETAADNRYVSVDAPAGGPANGVEDILPEMAIGRISARTPADVTGAISKTLDYEGATGDWQNRAVFVADNYADPAGNFHALSNEVRLNWLPAGYDDRIIYYKLDASTDTGAEMRAAIMAAFNADALMIQWFGHGSEFRWGSVSMFNIFNVASLAANDTWPFSVSYSCWTGLFSTLYDYNQALGETLVNTPQRGSVADLSPSGWHVSGAALTLNEGVALALFRDRIRPVGDAVDQAKLYYYANSGGFRDVIDTSILFGDPALKLRTPATAATTPPVTIAAVPSTAGGSAAALHWPHAADSAAYDVWRGTSPYFMPPATGVLVRTVDPGFRGASGPDVAFTDDGTLPGPETLIIIGDVATNYFWVVQARNPDAASGISNRVGEFDFALTPGE